MTPLELKNMGYHGITSTSDRTATPDNVSYDAINL